MDTVQYINVEDALNRSVLRAQGSTFPVAFFSFFVYPGCQRLLMCSFRVHSKSKHSAPEVFLTALQLMYRQSSMKTTKLVSGRVRQRPNSEATENSSRRKSNSLKKIVVFDM